MREEAQKIRERILEQLDLTQEIEDAQLSQMILEEIKKLEKERLLSREAMKDLWHQTFNSLRKLDILQELLDDEQITEIMVNGTTGIFYEKGGEIYQWDKYFQSKEKLLHVIQQIAGSSNRIINESHPILDTRLADGSRVNIVMEPAAVEGAVISIRKFPDQVITIGQLVKWGALSEEIVPFLEILIKSGYNIFVSGGTGSGKTTFLNALSEFIPKQERVIVIEDSAELQIQGISNLVRLETRQSRTQGVEAIDIRDLVKTSLRMRPDRLIVGEVRSGECLDLLQASNTGHRGTLSTGHANSAKDMLKRLETMVLMGGMELPVAAIRGQIASGIDILIHLGRLRDRSRKVLQIVEIAGIKDNEILLNPLYEFIETSERNAKICGRWKQVGKMLNRDKAQMAGNGRALDQIFQGVILEEMFEEEAVSA